MIYSLSSSDPEHYETINVNINIPWKCEQVKYYVSNVNTMSNFLLTTDEDFLLILMEDIEYPFTFTSRTDYESSLIKDLKELFNCYEKTKTAVIEKNEHGSLKFTLDKDLLPVSSTDKVYVCSSPPITNYANKLYLVSLQGQAIHASKEGMEYTPSVACSIDTFIKPGLPLIKDFDMNPWSPFDKGLWHESYKDCYSGCGSIEVINDSRWLSVWTSSSSIASVHNYEDQTCKEVYDRGWKTIEMIV